MSLTAAFKRLSPAAGSRGKYPLPPTSLTLETQRLLLRLAQPRDWQAWRDLRGQSQDFLKPWEPTWPPEALTFEYYSGELRRQWREWKDGRAYSFLVLLKETAQDPFAQYGQRPQLSQGEPADDNLRLVGSLTLSHIERGAAQKARLGYWVGQPYARRGIMTDTLRLIVPFAFETLALHRLEASSMPSNEPSKKLLLKLGFEEEGTAKAYLRINGAWEDHLLWGKVKKEG